MLNIRFMNEEPPDAVANDGPRACPECETPNQFGELCARCRADADPNIVAIRDTAFELDASAERYFDEQEVLESDSMKPGRAQHKWFAVAVYLCDQAWGGPEEGGWWYGTGSLVRVIRHERTEDRAYAYARRINARLKSRGFGPNRDRREMSSVLSEGEYWAEVRPADEVPAHYPEHRPHYE